MDRKRLAGCSMERCRFHATEVGCRVAGGIPVGEVDELFGPGGAMDQPSCPLLRILKTPFQGRESVVSHLYLIAQRVVGSSRASTVDLGYLITSVRSGAIDLRRREEGRPRCGGCRNYGWKSRRCLKRGSPYGADHSPEAEPHRLAPPCQEFHPIRAGTKEEWTSMRAPRRRSEAENVERALEILRQSDPAASALLVEHHIEGKSVRQISRATGRDRRQLTRSLKRAEELLGFILEDLV